VQMTEKADIPSESPSNAVPELPQLTGKAPTNPGPPVRQGERKTSRAPGQESWKGKQGKNRRPQRALPTRYFDIDAAEQKAKKKDTFKGFDHMGLDIDVNGAFAEVSCEV
ncbi:hypothetical protein KIPB_013136, partial [Kipferlia bialata]